MQGNIFNTEGGFCIHTLFYKDKLSCSPEIVYIGPLLDLTKQSSDSLPFYTFFPVIVTGISPTPRNSLSHLLVPNSGILVLCSFQQQNTLPLLGGIKPWLLCFASMLRRKDWLFAISVH